jgi:hypothetical protein
MMLGGRELGLRKGAMLVPTGRRRGGIVMGYGREETVYPAGLGVWRLAERYGDG